MKKIMVFLLLLGSISGFSKIHEVKMLNKGTNGEKMVFEPQILFIKKGDQVKFIPTDRSHNVMSISKKGGLPKGAKKWKGKTSKPHIQKFTVEGVHPIKCRPHMAMGMVGAIVVGKPGDLTQLKKLRLIGKSKKRFKNILKLIESRNL